MMGAISELHFIRPAWLLLIPPVCAGWWWWKHRMEPLRGWREQMDADLLAALIVRDQRSATDHSAFWLLTAWLLATIALAGPTWRLEPNPFAGDAQPLMVLLKASASMSAADLPPTRQERAQLKIADLAQARKGQPMGLIAYAGSAHLVLPPTKDTQIVTEMAAQISANIMPEAGDRLDLAIRQATALLEDQQAGGTLLVIADSVDQDPQALASSNRRGELPPIQFLTLLPPDSTESQSIQAAARNLGGQVCPRSIDDQDISAILAFSERRTSMGISGQSSRWQEAGYWLTPLLALMVAWSLRRTSLQVAEDA